MKNIEKFEEELKGFCEVNKEIGVVNGRPYHCTQIKCSDCDLCNNKTGNYCKVSLLEWLMAEYVEPKTITTAEKNLLQCLNPEYWIARDFDGELYVYEFKPVKCCEAWNTIDERYYSMSLDNFKEFVGDSFIITDIKCVKWEDAEPMQVKDLLKLEVME